MKYIGYTFFVCVLCMPLLTGWGESLRIVDAPTQLPCDTVLGAYSPPLCFEYSGLQMGQQYTLKIWLLSVGSWNCASSQWCERQFILDNTDGTQQAGVIQLAENMDVYDYSLFDWVLRLYDAQGNEEAFTERYTEGTTNRPPVLASIGHRQGRVGEQIEFTLSASDPEGNVISFMAQPLPAEATLNTNSGVFCWTPSVTGRYVVCFSATECEAAGLQDGELVEFLIRTGPVITAQPQSQTVPRGTSVMFSVETSDPGPLTYQWQFNGQDIPDATEASWPIQATQMSNAGIYRVLLSNAEGISVSEEAVLTVFIDRTATQAVEAGIEHLRREMDLYPWDNLAEHARQFVETMWDEAGGCYRTGTLEEDPDSRNETPGQLPLDTHSWSLLALPQILLLHPHLLECPEQHHRVTRDGFSGFDFNEDKDGVWLEGTAQMAVAYAAEGHTNAAEELCAILRAAQQLPAPIGNGLGTVAAVRDGMSTGFGFKLFRRLHLGATAWNVLAQLRGNPYYQTRTPSQFPCLRMKLPHVEENRILCQFPVQGGLTYRVEFRESLDAGGWQPLTTVHTLDGMIETGITSPITGPRCFYRVVEEHEPQ